MKFLFKMVFSKEDVEMRKLAMFYSLFTSIYFSLLIVILYWTEGFYNAGKCKFNFVIIFIGAVEVFKYILSLMYCKMQDVNLSRRHDDKSIITMVKNFFTKAKIKGGFRNVMATGTAIVIYSAIAILFGAELFNKHEETFMFSSLLSILTVLPGCLNMGTQGVVAFMLGGKPINHMEALMYSNFHLTVLGSWLGAFTIPLDWDRPWQRWPIPASLGAMIGYNLSHMWMFFKVKGGQRKRNKRSV